MIHVYWWLFSAALFLAGAVGFAIARINNVGRDIVTITRFQSRLLALELETRGVIQDLQNRVNHYREILADYEKRLQNLQNPEL